VHNFHKQEDKSSPPYIYLHAGDSVSIQLNLGAGNKIQDRFPYTNKVIVDLKDSSKQNKLQISAKGYTYAQKKITNGNLEPTTVTFSFAQEFGKYSVYTLAHPYFIKQVTFGLSDQSLQRMALRQINVYLSRSGYLTQLNNFKALLNETQIGKPGNEEQNLLEALSSVSLLDPYSPELNLLRAKIYFKVQNYTQALSQVELGIDKQRKYSMFLKKETKLTELQKFRAYTAKNLQNWDLAIKSMKESTPNIDRDFLSKVYLLKYTETAENRDFYQALRQALLHYKETPRFTLSTLRTFTKKDKFLHKALAILNQDIFKRQKDTIQLKSGEVISNYIVFLTKSLLNYWMDTPDSLSAALELANESEQFAESNEQEALTKAVQSLIYFSQGVANEKAAQYKKSAMDYFAQYTKLYADWESALQAAINQ